MIFFIFLIVGIVKGWFPWYIICLELFLWVPDLAITVLLIGMVISIWAIIFN